MNWEAAGAVGEIVGAVAVVATLVYLAKQMGLNTTAIHQTATQSIVMGRAEALRFIASDPEINALWWKGADNPDSLSEEEWQRFFMVVSSAVRPLELGYLNFEAGQMSEQLWRGQHNTERASVSRTLS